MQRRAIANGGYATVLRKGDAERGSILLFIATRGAHIACLERVMDFERGERWERIGPAELASSIEIRDFLARRARFDADLWAIELDIADPERFIAETTDAG